MPESLLQFRERDLAQPPLLIPPDRKQIIHAAAEPVPDTVLGNSSRARPMVHGNLQCPGAIPMHQNRQETVQAIEGENPVQGGPPEDAHGSAAIPEVNFQDASPRPARD